MEVCAHTCRRFLCLPFFACRSFEGDMYMFLIVLSSVTIVVNGLFFSLHTAMLAILRSLPPRAIASALGIYGDREAALDRLHRAF